MKIVVRHDSETEGIHVTTQPLSVLVDFGSALQSLSEYAQARVYKSPERIYVHSNEGVETLVREPQILFEAARRIGITRGVHVEYVQS